MSSLLLLFALVAASQQRTTKGAQQRKMDFSRQWAWYPAEPDSTCDDPGSHVDLKLPSHMCQQAGKVECMCRSALDDGENWELVCGECTLTWRLDSGSDTDNKDDGEKRQQNQAKRKEARRKNNIKKQEKKKERSQNLKKSENDGSEVEAERKEQRKKLRIKMKNKNKEKMKAKAKKNKAKKEKKSNDDNESTILNESNEATETTSSSARKAPRLDDQMEYQNEEQATKEKAGMQKFSTVILTTETVDDERK